MSKRFYFSAYLSSTLVQEKNQQHKALQLDFNKINKPNKYTHP